MTLLNTLLETCATLTKQVANLEQDKIAQAIEITKLKQRVRMLEKKRQFKSSRLKRLRKVGTAQKDDDEDVTLVDVEVTMDDDVQGRLAESQAKVYHLDLQHAGKVLSMQDTNEAEPAEVEEVIEVVTAVKLMTEVVTTGATTITVAQVPKASAPSRRRGVIIQDPEETAIASVIDEAFARELEAKLNANINWDNVMKQDAAKKQKIDEETEELKTHLQIIANDDDDVYTEATPPALEVPVVDYQIHHEHNKPYYKIIRVDGTHQLFLSFITLLKNFDKEDLEILWKLVQERFQSLKPKNFLDDFLLNTLKIMFEKPNIILLIEKKYSLTRFTLEQMLNNVRLEVEEESEMSLELLRLTSKKYANGLLLLVEDLMLLVKLKLLDENAAAAEKMKKLL
nr:hypothetical protein [Tanacetum cinerariifolium]